MQKSLVERRTKIQGKQLTVVKGHGANDFMLPVIRAALQEPVSRFLAQVANLQAFANPSGNLSLASECRLALENRPVHPTQRRNPLGLCRSSCLCNRCRWFCSRLDPCTRSGLSLRVCLFQDQPSFGGRPLHGQMLSLHM